MTMIRVGVLYGGNSPEHEISLRSAETVIKNLDTTQFEVIPIYLKRDLTWRIHDTVPLRVDTISLLALHPIVTCEGVPSRLPCDIVFSVLHGSLGEDGSMQGLLNLLGIPYIGTDVLGSAISMNKVMSKQLVISSGIVKVVPYTHLSYSQWQLKQKYYIDWIQDKVGYPVFVKPVNGGSSVGVTKVHHQDKLAQAVKAAFAYDTDVIVEKALVVRELEVSVLENAIDGLPALTSVVGEIVPRDEFYSYEAKYIDPQGASLQIPTSLNIEQQEFLQATAVKIFEILHGKGMARVDFFLEETTQELYFNEMNTLPGFSEKSLYPLLWQASNKPLSELLSDLIALAFARHERKARLQH